MMRFLTTKEMAARYQRTERTIQKWRADGTGPKFISDGGKIRYLESDVVEWEKNKGALLDQHYTTSQVADLTGLAEATLVIWRSTGRGPDYVKIDGRVYYPIHDTASWFIENGYMKGAE